MSLNLSPTIEERAIEIERLYDSLTKADIIRHLKEVQRETAIGCAQMINDDREMLIDDVLFGEKKKTPEEFADKCIRWILNTYLR